MISCTEFIVAYSELFAYLDHKHGRDEVSRFWKYLFEPDGKGIPLIKFVEKEGIRGCFSYWTGTLNEEAADFSMYVNEKRGFFKNVMHYCPSKGRLLQLKDEIGIEPYYDYCLHCDSYRSAVEKVGLKYIFDFSETDRAACSMLIYDPDVFDGRVVIDSDTEIIHRNSTDNEYFHPDFHSSMNMGVEYLGKNYGTEAVREYLEGYVQNCCRNKLHDIQIRGLAAIADQIADTYQKEKAENVLSLCWQNGDLEVRISACPAVTHLKKTGRQVSRWFPYTTWTVMEVFAQVAGCRFVTESYDPQTGAAEYRFKKAI